MSIRLAWKFVDASGATTIGHGRWVADTPDNREALARSTREDRLSISRVMIIRWVEDDASTEPVKEPLLPLRAARIRRLTEEEEARLIAEHRAKRKERLKSETRDH